MVNDVSLKTGGCWKVTTSHGTYYILDLDRQRGKRVPAEGRGKMLGDGRWFGIRYVNCVLGKRMILDLKPYEGELFTPWILSTFVTSIEPYIE